MTPARILLVEDDAIIAADLRGSLLKTGYVVLDVTDTGEDAVRLAATLGPDVILMDIGLKGALDGIAAAAAIRAQLNASVIFLTAHTDLATLERAKAVEPAGYLTKPFQLPTLVATMEVALYKHEMEARLRASEARYHAVLEQVFDGMLLLDSETGRVLEANAAAERLLGYTAGQLARHTIFSLTQFHDPAAVPAAFQALLNSGHYQIPERHYRHPDGTEVVIDIHANVIRYHDRQVVCVTLHDITERYRAEQSLREAERRYRTLVEQLPAMTYIDVGDGSGATVYVGPQVETLLGISPAEWLARDVSVWTEILHPEDRARVTAAYQRTIATGEPFSEDYRIQNRAGHWLWVHDEARLLPATAAQPCVVHGVMLDVTPRKQAEEALRESEARYRLIADNMTDVVWLAGFDRELQYISPSVQRVSGFTPEEILALPREAQMTPDSFQRAMAAWAQAGAQAAAGALASDQLYSLEIEYYRKDGSTYWAEIVASYVLGPDGQPTGVLGVSRNITERKRAEEALRASELKYSIVAQHTADWEYWVDPQGKMLYTSPSCQAITGYSADDFMARHGLFLSIVYPTDQDLVDQHREIVGPDRVEFRIVRADGSVRWLEHVCQRVYDADGQHLGRRASNRDITERKELESALRESEARYRRLAAHAPDIIFRYNLVPEMGLAYINPAVQTITGYSPEECYADPYLMLNMAHPDDASIMGEYLQSLTVPREPLLMRWVGKDGVIRWMESRVVPIRDEGGQMVAVEGITRDVTTRKQAEAALRESEARNRAILAALPDLMFVMDAEGRYVDYYAADPGLLAMPPEQFLGRRVSELFSGDLGAQLEMLIGLALRTGQTELIEYSLPIGFRPLWFEGRMARIDDQRVLIIVRDITDRKRAEAELHEQRDFALSVMNAMGQGLTVTDEHSRFDYVNPAYASFMGYQPEDLLSRSPGDLTFEPDQTVLEQAWADRQQGKTTFYETRLVRADGSLVDVLITGVPRWREGQVRGTIAVITDLTERKRAERALAEEHGRLRALIESSRDGLVFVGIRQPIRLINRRAMEYLNLPGQPEEWVGRAFSELLRVLGEQLAMPPAVNLEYDRIVRGDEPPGEGEWVLATRALHWLNLPVLADGQILGRLVVIHDVTHERQVEKMREDLTRTMVHDLRNPLTSMRGALQMMELDGLTAFSDDQREMLGVIGDGINALLSLVTAILDVSQLESGRMPLKRAPVELTTLVREVLHLEGPLAAQKRVALNTELAETLPLVDADAPLLQRVVQNLVGNALKFTPPGGAVRVAAALKGREVYVAVSDTGPGIAPDLQARLFQKFVTGRVPGHGSGLGLAFCRLVVEAHGGRIGVESAPGQGATFFFNLPLAPDP